jgi:hypothetical protein
MKDRTSCSHTSASHIPLDAETILFEIGHLSLRDPTGPYFQILHISAH